VLAEPHPQGGRLYGVSDAGAFTTTSAQHLRAAAARYPDDPGVSELVGEFLAGSAAFTRLWASHDVTIEPALCKTFQHPLVGLVTVNCDVLDITDRDQRVVIYIAAPGSPSEEALRLLSVIGTQRMDETRKRRSGVQGPPGRPQSTTGRVRRGSAGTGPSRCRKRS
jgi:hypothetical protein